MRANRSSSLVIIGSQFETVFAVVVFAKKTDRYFVGGIMVLVTCVADKSTSHVAR